MKYLLIFCLFIGGANIVFAQQQTAAQLRETAKTLMQQGDFDNAILTLTRARQQEPKNIEVMKDLSFVNYLKRDFGKAIEIGKELIENSAADQQSFQILGLSYKAIASYKDCAKLYKTALNKFPNSGVIYNEYAELLAIENNMDEAIMHWEKGIETDPNYSSNYYNATMYYMRSKNWIRALLYGELFLNIESYSTRTEEIKTRLFEAYKNLFAPGAADQLLNAKTTTAFEKAVLGLFAKTASGMKGGITVESIIAIRTLFIVEWLQGKQQLYPFRLFDHQQYLLNNGLFEAYNYWLFSTSLNPDAYQVWQNTHSKEFAGYKAFQQSRVFKIPAGQYYFSR